MGAGVKGRWEPVRSRCCTHISVLVGTTRARGQLFDYEDNGVYKTDECPTFRFVHALAREVFYQGKDPLGENFPQTDLDAWSRDARHVTRTSLLLSPLLRSSLSSPLLFCSLKPPSSCGSRSRSST